VLFRSYLYLRSERAWFGWKVCWLRNHVPGPATLDRQEWTQGRPPRLPRLACRHPQGAPRLVPDKLDLVWFDTGDGAALYEGDELLAVIPPWSGVEGFHGYSRDCREESELCWPLPQEPAFFVRLKQNRDWWQRWQDEPIWPRHQKAQLEAAEQVLGPHTSYFRLDQEHWPPRGAASFAQQDLEFITTIGIALRPQPEIYQPGESRPEPAVRLELGLFCSPNDSTHRLQQVAKLASLANYPWFHGRAFGDGHTITSELPDGNRLAVILISHHRFPSPWRDIALPKVDETPSDLLIALPLSESDLVAIRSPHAITWLEERIKTPARWIH